MTQVLPSPKKPIPTVEITPIKKLLSLLKIMIRQNEAAIGIRQNILLAVAVVAVAITAMLLVNSHEGQYIPCIIKNDTLPIYSTWLLRSVVYLGLLYILVSSENNAITVL